MPFFAIAALFVIGFIASILFAPKPKIEQAKAAQLSDFSFPRSDEGDPVPRIYGTVKSKGVNTIGQCNFQAIPIKKKVKTGLFSSKKQITGYKYQIGLDLAVCLGPGVVFRRLWYGKKLIWAGCLYGGDCVNRVQIDLPELLGGKDENGGIGGQVSLYCGAFDQSANSYLQENLATDGDIFPSYPGIAHMVFEDFYWGNSPSIDTIAAEVSYFTNSLALTDGKYVMPNGLDANPVEVLYDLFVNGWGNLGITDPIFNLDSWQAAAYTAYDEGNGISLEIANSNTGSDLAKEILRQLNAIVFHNPSTGTINIKLLRKDYDVDTLPVLGPDQLSSLRNFTKKLWEDTFNRVRIQYKNRDNDYNDAVATADDFANIRFQGRMKATDVGMPGVYVSDLANEIAARELSNLNVPLYQAEAVSDRTHVDLMPGDVFKLNWPEYGVASIVMRVRALGLGDRKDGKVSMTIVQDEFALDAVVMGTPPTPIGEGKSYAATDIASYATFELPYWLVNAAELLPRDGFTQYVTLAKRPGPASIDFFAFVDEGDDDTEALSNATYSATGKLLADLGQFDGFDTGLVATLPIGSVTNVSVIEDGSLSALQSDGQGLFMLNGEIMGYETFVDNGDGTFDLTNVHRALLDTAPVAALADDTLFFFDGQEGFWDTDVAIAPFTAYLIDRAPSGRSSEATAPHDALEPVGRALLPAPPDYVTLEGSRATDQFATTGDTVTFDWRERSRTAAAIAVEDDATQAAEAGTTYDLEITAASDGSVLQTEAAIAAATVDLALDAGLSPQLAVAKVWAVKGGDRSFSAALFPFFLIAPTTLVVDNSIVFVDGDTVEF